MAEENQTQIGGTTIIGTMKIEWNNDHKVFMSIPNINFWYEGGIYIYIGWLFWGINIVIKD